MPQRSSYEDIHLLESVSGYGHMAGLITVRAKWAHGKFDHN